MLGRMDKNIRNRRRGFIENDLFSYRKKRGYSQRDIASLLGHKSSAHISDYEKGKRLPNLKTALKLAVILSVQVDDLFDEIREEFRGKIQIKREKLYEAKSNS